jgi:TolA-binding protein
MGNYAGFPILQFYFPLPFLIMSLLDLVMPLQVTFKLVTLLGTALLPVCAYVMLRLIRCPFPGPGIGAALMLPFLFNGANSMWGGNILSTLAGEFSYSLSMALSLVLIGSLYRGALEEKYLVRNGILVFLVGFSHGYTLLFVEAVSLFILITPTGFMRRAVYLFKVYALGFFLLAFWLVPLLVFTRYTTSYHLVWTINSVKEIVPEILLPFLAAGIAGSVILLLWGLRTLGNSGLELIAKLAYLWFGVATAIVFFVAAPQIGVVDIRYVPYGQLMICLLAALSFGWLGSRLLNRWGLNLIFMVLAVAFTMHWTNSRVGAVDGWSKWNYEGFEGKRTWPIFKQINKELAGSFQDPRVVYEHSADHNIFGSTRAFESLPLFAGRATLEGLYMQASISAPFVFYIQSLVSSATSQPFPQYSYTNMDFDRARGHLELFNVRDLVIRSTAAKQAIRKVDEFKMKSSIGQYELWELSSNPNRYVTKLENEPVLYQADSWKEISYQWFIRDDLRDVHLVFPTGRQESIKPPMTQSATSLDMVPKVAMDYGDCEIKETIHNDAILIDTTCLNKPLLVKVSYHPNWRVEGADRIHLVSPSFMLIYPRQQNVRLSYGPGSWDKLGMALTGLGIVILLLNVPLPGRKEQTSWSLLAAFLHIPVDPMQVIPVDPVTRSRWLILALTVTLAGSAVVWLSYQTYINEPYRIFNRSIRFKDTGRYEEARAGFENFIKTYPVAGRSQDAAYYIAITYYLEKKDNDAIQAFEELVRRYPQSSRVPEAHYHIGMSLFRSNREEEGIRKMEYITATFPVSAWAKYGAERLKEHRSVSEKESLDIHTGTLDYYMGKAVSYFNQDRLAEAKPIFQEIVDRYPGFSGTPQALAALALCHYKEGDCQGTIENYQKLLERYPDHGLAAEAYFHIGICHERSGNNDLAVDAFRKVLAVDPEGVYGEQARTKISQ